MTSAPETGMSPDSRARAPDEAERTYSFYYLYDPTTSSHGHRPTPKAPNEHYVNYMDPWQDPWQDVIYAYSWAQEYQFEEMMRQNIEAVEWALRQQQQFTVENVSHALDDMYRSFETGINTETWLKQAREASARRERRRARREAEMARLLQREAEKRKKDREEKQRKAKAAVKAWRRYEERWGRITGQMSEEGLSFAMIPWPTVSRPTDATEITKDSVRELLLSRHHSKDVSNKDRIRAALKLWHPDKFKRVLDRVEEKERSRVEKAAGAVARCLNGLMEEIQNPRQ